MARLIWCLVIFLAAVLVNCQPDVESYPDGIPEDDQILISPDYELADEDTSNMQDANQSEDSSSSESEESDEAIHVEAQSGSDEISKCARKIRYESCQLNVEGLVRNF